VVDANDPRPAATVIAARQADGGVEVLVLRRGQAHRFLPGYLVFPGGAVDPEDARLAERWFGSPGDAARACAIRELLEEAGLALTAEGLIEVAVGNDLSAIDAAPPRRGALEEVSHWIAPEEVPVRFDARFYAVEAAGHVNPRPDGAEADAAWWASPSDVLRDFTEGRVQLYWPTLKTMETLAACRTVEEVLALRILQEEHQ
jgi:8-oxo-dGTP pyrophosphatase MutT (NUDIX family)